MQINAVTPRAISQGDATTAAGTLRVGQFNVENLFDTVDDPRRNDTVLSAAAYDLKLQKLAIAIRDNLGAPDVLALEEVEGLNVLQDLVQRPELKGLGYQAVLMSGNDARGINVGMIYRGGTIEVTKAAQANAPLQTEGNADPALLFSRPPLVVDAVYHPAAGLRSAAEGQELTFIVNHFKSKLGGPAATDKLREAQATFVAGLVDARVAADPKANVLVLGDLNADDSEKPLQLLGKHADGSTRLSSATAGLDAADRYSWGKSKGQRELFDHILVTGGLQEALSGTKILHFNTTAPKGSNTKANTGIGVSDHDPVIATFLLK